MQAVERIEDLPTNCRRLLDFEDELINRAPVGIIGQLSRQLNATKFVPAVIILMERPIG